VAVAQVDRIFLPQTAVGMETTAAAVSDLLSPRPVPAWNTAQPLFRRFCALLL
jgi:hypothetical protein